jgi:hypothetical protein
MSKCDITIEFDRSDRIYQGGETVTGQVHVAVNRDLTSNGIKLTRFWKTHGYGNTDRGEQMEEMLDTDSQLTAGETRTYPFSFVADLQPLTYRGHHINIDHYVRVDVDVPWAIDPNLEEEYVLIAGEIPAEITGSRDKIIDFTPENSTEVSLVAKVLGYTALGLLLAMLCVVTIWLLPVVPIVYGIIWFRKKLVVNRLGEVRLSTPHLVVVGGQSWPLDLQFTPRKNTQINGIHVKFHCEESATSGSGTNKKTRNHTLHDVRHTLEPEGSLTGGEEYRRSLPVMFPETEAYSFDRSSNKIKWTVEVRVDIPMFPDWTSSQSLQVLPSEFLQDSATGNPDDRGDRIVPDAGSPVHFPEPQVFEAAAVEETMVEDTASAESAAAAWSGPDTSPEVLDLVERIAAADRFGSERTEIVERWTDDELDVLIDVERVSSTFGATEDAAWQHGQTILGKIAGTDQSIEVMTRTSQQECRLSRGSQWRTRITVSKWDSLYDRLVTLDVSPD